MNYRIGDKVKIKQWETMEIEYGLDEEGDIDLAISFITEMRKFCGKEMTIIDMDGSRCFLKDADGYTFTPEMFVNGETSECDFGGMYSAFMDGTWDGAGFTGGRESVSGARECLGDYPAGSIIKLGEREHIVLEQLEETTVILSKDFVKKMAFGRTADYLDSSIRAYLNGEYYTELAGIVGEENIVKHAANLTADDGTGANNVCEDCVSILTTEKYRRYRKIIPAYGEWWYTATRVNATEERYARSVCYVDSDGVLDWRGCGLDCGGVRPFCVLKSSTLVS